ncbi:hypothetical protein cyc_05919 [Cyclospora cayetanensis]|uniref:Uncharacterized protein n=1 Tax=Cyclospora cayetanensis TaxID=88456 RepID=A0A1D3CWN0_9EIME|nr:hypothetical protein cyc_05919 [Cyclospora cayetanensis]
MWQHLKRGTRCIPCKAEDPRLRIPHGCTLVSRFPLLHHIQAQAEARLLSCSRLISRKCSTSASRGVPFFLSGVARQAADSRPEALWGEETVSTTEGTDVCVTVASELPPSQCTRPFSDSGIAASSEGTPINRDPDLQRLQSRYDSLLRNPEMFGLQVRFLHSVIQEAQHANSKCSYLKEVAELQERIRTPGTSACLEVHPVVYAAFCVYSPSHILVAVAKRVGAAEHFLRQYRAAKTLRRPRRQAGVACSANGRVRGSEQWLQDASLQNICVYPLEALAPKLRLFHSSAPLRLAVWEEILVKALAH